MQIPHTRAVAWPELRESRFASLIRTESAEGCAVGLIGLPDDTGVALNFGNPGAGTGPDAFRAALAQYGTATPESLNWPAVFDVGNVQPGTELDETHRRVTEATAALLDAGLLPVAIGGGHDLTFPFVRAVAERSGPLGGIYLDAHLDVREEPGSGMPFRALVEHSGVARLDVIGLDRFSNTHDHTRWFLAHGGRIDALEPNGDWPGEDLFVSIDLDAIDASHAPGVSARNPAGLSVREAAAWAYAAGASPLVRCFDIMELCPPRDEHARTARVAARLFLEFLAGLTTRGDRPE
ncbi:MAG: formimidoylglutamase [Planctomycetota bacterium]